MDVYDVSHLFNCIAHPIDLTPENLCNTSVKAIQELSILDHENQE